MPTWLVGSRKLLITVVTFATSVILLLFHVINADQWVTLNKFIIPAFLAANLISKFKNGKEINE